MCLCCQYWFFPLQDGEIGVVRASDTTLDTTIIQVIKQLGTEVELVDSYDVQWCDVLYRT